jgi:Leucine-rich repeat (LRR) protein
MQELDCHLNNITSLNPLVKCINLRELNCHLNNITSLNPLVKCINLRELNCHYNNITSLNPLVKCINLRELNCHYNQITSLDPLVNLINLQELNCDTNQITFLNPLANCINLQKINICNNQITLLNPLANCINLQILNICNNQIISLEPLANCVNLQKLDCDGNQITSLGPTYEYCERNIHGWIPPDQINKVYLTAGPLANCINLQILNCRRNQITSLECLVYLRHLNLFLYSNNPLTIQSIQVQRFLDRFTIFNKNNNIYQDKQNVHDVTIQKTICESLQSLLRDPKSLFSIDDIIESDLSSNTKESLIEYCQDESVHSIHLITYGELLGYIWQRIIKSNHKEELFKILEEQTADSECKCFTGRFNRFSISYFLHSKKRISETLVVLVLQNCNCIAILNTKQRTLSILVGFYDDIKINISDNARISAIIIACKGKIKPYDPTNHKKMAEKELAEAGYTVEEIKPCPKFLLALENNLGRWMLLRMNN